MSSNIIISSKKHTTLNNHLKIIGSTKIITNYSGFRDCFKQLKHPFNCKIIIIPELDWEDTNSDDTLLGAKLVEKIRLEYACIVPIAFVSFFKREQIKADIPIYMDNVLIEGENFFRLPYQDLAGCLKKKFINTENRRDYAERILRKLVDLEYGFFTDNHTLTLEDSIRDLRFLSNDLDKTDFKNELPKLYHQFICTQNCYKVTFKGKHFTQDINNSFKTVIKGVMSLENEYTSNKELKILRDISVLVDTIFEQIKFNLQ